MINASSSGNPPHQAHQQEAWLLVETLRTSRLALLIAEVGSDKSAFLNAELVPLLQRRATDRAGSAATPTTGVVVPFPDRRRRGRGRGRASQRRFEVVVLFDDWSKAPLASLKALIAQAARVVPGSATAAVPLGDTLRGLGDRLDAKFIVLLDRFEEFLRLPPQREDVAAFTNELADAVNQDKLPAAFLISVDEQARPALADLRSRIPNFYDFSLRLSRPAALKPATPAGQPADRLSVPVVTEPLHPVPLLLTEVVTMVPAAVPKPSTRRPKVKQPRPPPVPIKTEDVYDLIQATLSRIAPDPVDEPAVTGARAVPAAVRPGKAAAPRPAAAPAPSAVMPPRGQSLDEAHSEFAKLSANVRRRAQPSTLSARWQATFGWITRRLRRARQPE